MAKKKNPDQDFQEAMRSVKPLKASVKKQYPCAKKTVPCPTVAEAKPAVILPSYEHGESFQLTATESVFWHQPGSHQKSFRSLKQGKITVRATLDLHGMTQDQARQALHHFLEQCQRQAHSYALIIHGKGLRQWPDLPVLKNLTCQFLSQCRQVKAFCTALDRHGGSGAVYVQLKIKATN